jgi:hypothetical protein
MAEVIGRDSKSGRFLAGNSGNGGRRRGSRNKLAEDFIADFAAAWAKHGPAALELMAATEPARFVAAAVQLMPRDVAMSLDVDVRVERGLSALEAYRTLKALPVAELKALRDAEDE